MPTPCPQLPSHVTVAILAGGLGTRLRPVISDRPKVLAPVLDRPFLSWWLDNLESQGFREIVLCTGFMADQVEGLYGANYGSLKLRYSVEDGPLGTGGALGKAAPLLNSDPVLVLNGDSFCEADLGTFLRQHLESRDAASLILTAVPETSRYGRVQVRPDGRAWAMREKSATPGPGWINAGIYLFSRRLLAGIPPGKNVSLERDLLPCWIHQGVRCHMSSGAFIDIGTPESLAQANSFFSKFVLAA